MKILTIICMFLFFVEGDEHTVSWYGKKFHGKQTASGEIYDMHSFTCAATRKYSFGDTLKVTNIKNNKSVIVVVNDRGDLKKFNRTLDLSKKAFSQIANLDKGLIKVTIEKINVL